MLQLRPRETLDGGHHGWLNARHHFVVAANGNLANRPLGALVVWNDDEIAPGTGFGRHSHADMEIITYVRQGAVTHEDSAGNVGYTVEGDVQVMSAGTGISHSERNRGEVPLKLFQIWLLPGQRGGTPRWESRRFPKTDRAGQLVTLASGDPWDVDALQIRADARVMGATLLAGTTLTHRLGAHRHAYLAPAKGAVFVNGERVVLDDGIAATDEASLTITAEEDAELILVTTS
ncbi:Quercetin 2,3-dioxygenase [Dyella sp. AD56]|uniref:pirin family protein n=1 Tax=Dyella sp. AD56 TaxID=1528744 RepID=UPI000C839903|nr:pirin family protein [Dyella sp. AD56]PMQ04628.1 Quercetin 2,3-dioxygenase [Dyella sp. AD56]